MKKWTVYVPVNHHEMYVGVPGNTPEEAIKEWGKNPCDYHCIGEVSRGTDKFYAEEEEEEEEEKK